jgi:hypothetical protein
MSFIRDLKRTLFSSLIKFLHRLLLGAHRAHDLLNVFLEFPGLPDGEGGDVDLYLADRLEVGIFIDDFDESLVILLRQLLDILAETLILGLCQGDFVLGRLCGLGFGGKRPVFEFDEVLLYLDCHPVYLGGLGVEAVGVQPYFIDVGLELDRRVVVLIKLLLDSAEVHGVLDDGAVLGDAEFLGVDWFHEGVGLVMGLEQLEYLVAALEILAVQARQAGLGLFLEAGGSDLAGEVVFRVRAGTALAADHFLAPGQA